MADPLDVLRSPAAPVQPDAAFAERLRARLRRALDLPKGVTVSDLATDVLAPPTRTATATPYLAVADARAALDWYGEALGARLRGEPIVMPDERIGHAEIDLGGAVVMLSDAHPEIGVVAPEPGAGVPVTIVLEVPDVDAAVVRAVGAGAHLDRPAADNPYGRNAVLRDPFGHRWMISGPNAGAGVRHGDIGYVSLQVPDVERAAGFFSAVLGWQVEGRQVRGLSLHHGLWDGEPRRTLFCAYAVDDVEAAVERVRAAGGTASEPHDEPYGRLSDCEDDQGVRFAVYQPPGGTGPVGPAPHGALEGDVAYLTMEVPDAARTRAFYGAVLGWRFEAGRVADGWQVVGPAPSVGIAGGHPVATIVPMYRVADVDAAVGRVHAAGGTAANPEPQPYGITATCTDDQGTRFYLGQLA